MSLHYPAHVDRTQLTVMSGSFCKKAAKKHIQLINILRSARNDWHFAYPWNKVYWLLNQILIKFLNAQTILIKICHTFDDVFNDYRPGIGWHSCYFGLIWQFANNYGLWLNVINTKAQRCLRGNWGNQHSREKRLIRAGQKQWLFINHCQGVARDRLDIFRGHILTLR